MMKDQKTMPLCPFKDCIHWREKDCDFGLDYRLENCKPYQGLYDEMMILLEVKDHATYWQSDMAKRITVEKHLAKKGIGNVEVKIDLLIRAGKLVLIPKPRGDYLKVMI